MPYHLREWVETGRARLILLALSTFLAGAAILYAMYGPDRLWNPSQTVSHPPGAGSSAGDDDDDDDDDGAGTTDYEGSGAVSDSVRSSPVRPHRDSEAVELLRAEL